MAIATETMSNPSSMGVPVKLSDPVALRRIADILGEARDPREQDTRRNSQAR